MASKKLGALIKEARTEAGLTQEQLAKKVKGATASDISKAERGEKDLTQDQLKAIAKATGVTQKSLLDAASSKSSSSSKKTSSSSAKKTSSSSSSSSKKTSSGGTSVKVTATEKKLLELYRAADSDTKKKAMNVLKGEEDESLLGSLLENADLGDAFSSLKDLIAAYKK